MSYDATTASVPADAWRRSWWHGDQGGHGFDAVREVLLAEVFVGGGWVIVVGDGDVMVRVFAASVREDAMIASIGRAFRMDGVMRR